MAHKFKIGDIVRHAATKKHNGIRMIVLAVGSLKDESSETLIYQVSGQKSDFSEHNVFMGSYLQEKELISVDSE